LCSVLIYRHGWETRRESSL